jgi:DNA-directed RNA polymerase specialized sigma24 family protein
MSQETNHREPSWDSAGIFQTTHWSAVRAAGGSGTPQSGVALETLCRVYWYPLYAYVRRQGHGAHDAQDLTQEFFARLLQKNYLKLADQERGRFRSFLLKSLQNFLVNEWARGQARKRGGGAPLLPLDEAVAERLYRQESTNPTSAETLFDKRWATTLLDRAFQRLQVDYAAAGKGELFQQLQSLLLNEGSAECYRTLGGQVGLSEGAVKVAVHRLRHRFKGAVRSEVAQTVATAGEVDEELRCLMTAMIE